MTKSPSSKREQKARRAHRERSKLEAKLAALRAANDRRARELGAILRADIRDILEDDGTTPKRLQDLPEDLRLAIAECDVDPTTGRIRRVIFKDRIDAAEEFLAMLGEARKPEVQALIKAARANMRRANTIIEAMAEMRRDTTPPKSMN